jgi:hypothetical protein
MPRARDRIEAAAQEIATDLVACALSAVALGYAACALVLWIRPASAANFKDALFHGLDFRKLQSGPTPYSFGTFFYALVS